MNTNEDNMPEVQAGSTACLVNIDFEGMTVKGDTELAAGLTAKLYDKRGKKRKYVSGQTITEVQGIVASAFSNTGSSSASIYTTFSSNGSNSQNYGVISEASTTPTLQGSNGLAKELDKGRCDVDGNWHGDSFPVGAIVGIVVAVVVVVVIIIVLVVAVVRKRKKWRYNSEVVHSSPPETTVKSVSELAVPIGTGPSEPPVPVSAGPSDIVPPAPGPVQPTYPGFHEFSEVNGFPGGPAYPHLDGVPYQGPSQYNPPFEPVAQIDQPSTPYDPTDARF